MVIFVNQHLYGEIDINCYYKWYRKHSNNKYEYISANKKQHALMINA